MNELEKLLRDDLRDVAGSVDIPVSLDAIAAEHDALMRRTTRKRWGLTAAVIALLVAAVVAAVVVAQSGLFRVPDRAVPNPLQSPSAEPVPSPSADVSSTAQPSPDPTGGTAGPTASGVPTTRTVGVYVYFVSWGTGESQPDLVREVKQVPAATPARGAVEAMFAGAADPDYQNLWDPGVRVLGISKHGDVITIDLSGEAQTIPYGVSGEGSMIDQLVWTLTEAFEPTDRVLILVEGRTFETGHNVYDEPLPRQAGANSPIRVVVDTPAHGATVDQPVRVTGLAATFEAVLHWKVTRGGTEVAAGTTLTEEGMTLAPFAFDLPRLEPGTHVLTVTQDDPSGGAGWGPTSDTKEFTVR